ncbi:MAG: 30S ribosome-binding factor RbfA [Clostridiales bacterium]|nr:30S ribosome-binding factor RbfA [Clostridiales bacterium]
MGKYRQHRVGDAARQEICDILRDVKDPRVSSAFITVTSVDVTPDFKYAKVFYSTLSDNATAEEKKELAAGLRSAAGFIRSQLAQRLNLRITPELSFILDDSLRRGVDIAAKINNLEFNDIDTEDTEEDEKA